MHEDHIVEKVRKVRQKYAEKFNFDLEAIYQDLKKKETTQKERVVSLSEKRNRKTDLAE